MFADCVLRGKFWGVVRVIGDLGSSLSPSCSLAEAPELSLERATVGKAYRTA